MVAKDRLDFKAVFILTILCMVWGVNAVAIKLTNAGIDPVLSAGLRSLIAAVALSVWMKIRGIPLFPGSLGDGMIVGALFGVEFAFLFTSVEFTTVSSAWILLYTTPFFHALGAHFFLKGDRLTPSKIIGLLLAFSGIVVLLSEHVGLPSARQLLGDLCAMTAAALWAATTIVIKRRLVGRVSPHHSLFYQILFSTPILFLLSVVTAETAVLYLDALVVGALLFQGLVVAFVSYLVWFHLVHDYPVSRLSSFTFLTPIFATVSGVLILQEALSGRLIAALVLVSIGIYVVNRN